MLRITLFADEMKKPSQLLVPLGILITILGVAAVCIAVSPLGGMLGSMIAVSHNYQNLKARTDAHELGAVMAGVLRDPSHTAESFLGGDDKRMPARLLELRPSFLSLDPKKGIARLELGGGFYHYGYEIQTEGDRRYRMMCYGETEEDVKELGAFQYNQDGDKP